MADNFDSDWRPNGRPQSTIARNFSAALDDLFKLDGGSLDNLSQNVHEKKHKVSTQNQELEALEARLRETEERLKQVSAAPGTRATSRINSQRRTPVRPTFAEKKAIISNDRPSSTDHYRQTAGPSPAADRDPYATPTMPGSMPEMQNSAAGTESAVIEKGEGHTNDESTSEGVNGRELGER